MSTEYRVYLSQEFVEDLVNTMTMRWDVSVLKPVKYVAFTGFRDDWQTPCEGTLSVTDIRPDGLGLLFVAEGLMQEEECNIVWFTIRNSEYRTYISVRPSSNVRFAPNMLVKLALKVSFSKIQPEVPGKINMDATLVNYFFYKLADVLLNIDKNPNLKWSLVPDAMLVFTDVWSYYDSRRGAVPLPANVGIERTLETSLSPQTIESVVVTLNLTEGKWMMMMGGHAPISQYFKVYMSMAFMTYITVKIEANAMVFVGGQQVYDGDSVPTVIGEKYVVSAYGEFSKLIVRNLDTLQVSEYEGVNEVEIEANADYEVIVR